MVPLGSLQRFMTWIFINPTVETTTTYQKITYAIIGFLVLIFQLIGLAASGAYLTKYMSSDLEQSMYSVFQSIAMLTGSYSFMFSCYSRHEINGIFESLSIICSKCKHHIGIR